MLDTFPLLAPSKLESDFSVQRYITDAQLLLDIFTINCFSINSRIVRISSNGYNADSNIIPLQVFMSVPANLWSQQVLRKQKILPINDFEIKVLSALASSRGFKLSLLSTKVLNSIDVYHNLLLTKF